MIEGRIDRAKQSNGLTTTILSGASGFIGRRLAVRLRSERATTNVICLVKEAEDSFGARGVDFLLSRSIRVLPTDLVQGTGLGELPKPKLLFHLAANTHTWEHNQSCNDMGTRNMLQALGTLGPANHVVFTSTTAVMDNRSNLAEPLGHVPMVVRKPFSGYGQSKLRAEEFLRAESVRQGFPLSIVRLCTVYGPQPRPNSLFDVMKREVAEQTLASRLNWPGLTSFIHVEDVASCLIAVGDNPPNPGNVQTYLLATESKTLADVSHLLYTVKGLVYRMISLPKVAWRVLGNAHRLCRFGASALPCGFYNAIWRLNMVVNPIFYCDTRQMRKWFPNLKPRLMTDCIHEI